MFQSLEEKSIIPRSLMHAHDHEVFNGLTSYFSNNSSISFWMKMEGSLLNIIE